MVRNIAGCPFIGICLMFFSLDRLWILERKMSFYHIILSTWFITVNADFDHLAYLVFVRFLHCNVTLFYSPICTLLFGGESVCASHTSGVGGRAAPLFGGVSTKPIWNSSAPICLFSPLLIYSVIFLSSWTHGY